MSIIYCMFCDTYSDTDLDDEFQLKPVFKCGHCVQAEEWVKAAQIRAMWNLQQQFQWWQQEDTDRGWIESNQ